MQLTRNTSVCLVILGVLFFTAGLVQGGDLGQKWVACYNGSGNGWGTANAIAVDGSGNVYVTGVSDGNYVTIKYDTNGNQIWVARYNGPGNGYDEAHAIALDSSGNVYVTGDSDSNYATIKYDVNGDEMWVARYNGPEGGWGWANAIAVDGSGNVYVTGYSQDSNANPAYATIKYAPDGDEMWVARYNGPGNEWNKYDEAYAIALDSSGNVYVTGQSASSSTGENYATIKYDPDGDEMWVARYNGSDYDDRASAIAVDGSGNVYVTGKSRGWGMGGGPDYDYATVKYDANGNQLWVSIAGGGGDNGGARAIALDGSGNVYITGRSCNSNPCPGMGMPCSSYDDSTIKYDPDGNQIWIAHNLSGGATAIALDSSGKVYVTGYSETVEYDTSGNEIGFALYNSGGATAIAVDGSGHVYVTGAGSSYCTYSEYTTIKYGQGCNAPSWCEGADINNDGRVDFEDFAILANHWLEGINP